MPDKRSKKPFFKSYNKFYMNICDNFLPLAWKFFLKVLVSPQNYFFSDLSVLYNLIFSLTVQKEGPNKGRPFYACPAPRGQGCNYFQWADEDGGGGGGFSSGGEVF